MASGDLGAWIVAHPDGLAAVQSPGFDSKSPLTEAVESVRRAGWVRVFDVAGYNYSVGRDVVVIVYARRTN